MRIVRKLTKTWQAGKVSFDLDLLPKLFRIDQILVKFIGQFNVPAAGLTPDQQTRFLASVEGGRRLRTDGTGLNFLDWHTLGADFYRPPQVAQNAAADVTLRWALEYADRRAIEPKDGSVPTEFYEGQTLDLYFAKPSDLVAALAVNSGDVEVTFYMSKRPQVDDDQGNRKVTVPRSTVFGYAEVTGKSTKLPAGRLVDLFLAKLDGSPVTDAELGNMHLIMDSSTNLLERVRLHDLVDSFNRNVAKGAQVQGATDGVEGESIDPASAICAPVWHPVDERYKATSLPSARTQYEFLYDGTLAANAARLYFRIIEDQDEVKTAAAAAKLGVKNARAMAGKTASKNGISGDASFKATAGAMARVVVGEAAK